MSSIYQSNISLKDVPRSSAFNSNIHSYAPFSRISRINRNQRDISMDFGSLRSASLANLISPKQETLERPAMKKLATTHNNKIIVNQQVVREIGNLYPNNLIAFYAVYGPKDAGKSFWCDKTYDLSDVGKGNGRYYTQNTREQGVYFLNVPFTKGDIKIFLLDCTGFSGDRLSRNQEIRLDFIMSLSSAVLLLPQPDDKQCKVMNTAYYHFCDSQKRLRMFDQPANKRSGYWPHSCYCLYRTTEPVSKNLEDLGLLFEDYNFSIIQDAKNAKFQGENKEILNSSFLDIDNTINEQYLNHVAYVTRDVYDKIWGKKFGNLKSNGRVISRLIPNLALAMNARQKVPMEKIFDDTTKDLYDDAVKKSSVFYSDSVRNQFPEAALDNPTSSKTIINSIGRAKSRTYGFFDNESKYIDPTSKYANDAENKIDDMMRNQQRMMLDVNKKNSIKYLEKTLPRSKDQKIQTNEDFRQYLMKLKNTDPDVDMGRTDPVAQRLKQACDQSKSKIFVTNPENQKLFLLQQGSDKKRDEILSLEKRIREKQSKQTNIKESLVILRSKQHNLDQEIERLKRRNQTQQDIINNPNQQEADRLRLQEMNKTKKQYEQRLLEIQRERDQYNKWHSNKDNLNSEIMISTLLTKLSEKKKEKQKNQSVFYNSQLTSKLATSGVRVAERRDVVRDKINRSRMAL